MTSSRLRSRCALVVVGMLAALLAGCAGAGSDVGWRNIEVDLPEGWHVFEETDSLLSVSNVDLARHADEGTFPDADVVAMHFTYEPSTVPDDWRALIEQRDDATLETDDRLELDGEVPATRLIYTDTSAGVPTREMVVLIPSRAVVVIAQPVPRPGQEDAPEVFLEYVDTFVEVLETASFGRPVLED